MSLDMIIARQKELADAVVAEKTRQQHAIAAAKQLFEKTGIPAAWEQIKDIRVPHWRGSADERAENMIPLSKHVKEMTDTSLALLDHDGGTKISWYVELTDKGARYLRIGGRIGHGKRIGHAPDAMLQNFVNTMAHMIPPMTEQPKE